METDRRNFFMKSVEIRILAAVLTRITHRAFEEHVSAHNADVSGLQYGILRSLNAESSTLSELSRRFWLDPSTLVPVIATLERKALIARGRDPHDRRRWSISITPAGAQLIRDLPVVHENDLLFKCLESMGEEKTDHLREMLREIVHRLPEGDEMLDSVTSRLYTLQDGEPENCAPHHHEHQQAKQEQADEVRREREHHRMIGRTIRRQRTRRTHGTGT
jgi:DNA-binding MarR family transcriptional regulator